MEGYDNDNGDFGQDDENNGKELFQGQGNESLSPGVVVTTENDFSFLDIEAMQKPNAWVGARHWQYNMRARQPANGALTTGDGNEGEAAVGPKKRGKKVGKRNDVVDFTDELVDQSIFVLARKPGGRSDPTVMTQAAMDKAMEASNELLLPLDAKVEVQDLCRLFLRPTMRVPPPGLRHLIAKPQTQTATFRPRCSKSPFVSRFGCSEDIVWGECQSNRKGSAKVMTKSVEGIRSFNLDDEGDGDGDGGDYCDDGGDDNDCDGNYYENNDNGNGWDNDDNRNNNNVGQGSGEVEAERKGLEYRVTGGLLQASRVVEKLQIGYASAAKRVNVRRLKADMWRRLDTICTSSAAASDLALPRESLTF
eukprot:gene42780-56864_t